MTSLYYGWLVGWLNLFNAVVSVETFQVVWERGRLSLTLHCHHHNNLGSGKSHSGVGGGGGGGGVENLNTQE